MGWLEAIVLGVVKRPEESAGPVDALVVGVVPCAAGQAKAASRWACW
jgi:hypothetical protein